MTKNFLAFFLYVYFIFCACKKEEQQTSRSSFVDTADYIAFDIDTLHFSASNLTFWSNYIVHSDTGYITDYVSGISDSSGSVIMQIMYKIDASKIEDTGLTWQFKNYNGLYGQYHPGLYRFQTDSLNIYTYSYNTTVALSYHGLKGEWQTFPSYSNDTSNYNLPGSYFQILSLAHYQGNYIINGIFNTYLVRQNLTASPHTLELKNGRFNIYINSL